MVRSNMSVVRYHDDQTESTDGRGQYCSVMFFLCHTIHILNRGGAVPPH